MDSNEISKGQVDGVWWLIGDDGEYVAVKSAMCPFCRQEPTPPKSAAEPTHGTMCRACRADLVRFLGERKKEDDSRGISSRGPLDAMEWAAARAWTLAGRPVEG